VKFLAPANLEDFAVGVSCTRQDPNQLLLDQGDIGRILLGTLEFLLGL
jgi:hypothetical protein